MTPYHPQNNRATCSYDEQGRTRKNGDDHARSVGNHMSEMIRHRDAFRDMISSENERHPKAEGFAETRSGAKDRLQMAGTALH
jgi:hypothetical protein